jgi:hypothetical protein
MKYIIVKGAIINAGFWNQFFVKCLLAGHAFDPVFVIPGVLIHSRDPTNQTGKIALNMKAFRILFQFILVKIIYA